LVNCRWTPKKYNITNVSTASINDILTPEHDSDEVASFVLTLAFIPVSSSVSVEHEFLSFSTID
jgi:hypothetical protein